MSRPRLGSGRTPEVAVHLQAAGSGGRPERGAEWSLRAAQEARARLRLGRGHPARGRRRRPAAGQRVRPTGSGRGGGRRRAAAPAGRAAASPRPCRCSRQRFAATSPPVIDSAAGMVHSRIGGALCLHHSVMDIPRALEHFEAAERLLRVLRAVPSTCTAADRQAAMFGLRTALLGIAADRAAAIAAEAGPARPGRVRRLGQALGGGQRGTTHRCRRELARALWATAHELSRPLSGLDAGQRGGAGVRTPTCWTRRRRDVVPARSRTAAVHRVRPQPRHRGRPARPWPWPPLGELACRPRGDVRPCPAGRSGASDDDLPRRGLGAGAGRLGGAVAADEAAGDLHDAALNSAVARHGQARPGRPGRSRRPRWSSAGPRSGPRGPQVPTELAARAELARALRRRRPGRGRRPPAPVRRDPVRRRGLARCVGQGRAGPCSGRRGTR